MLFRHSRGVTTTTRILVVMAWQGGRLRAAKEAWEQEHPADSSAAIGSEGASSSGKGAGDQGQARQKKQKNKAKKKQNNNSSKGGGGADRTQNWRTPGASTAKTAPPAGAARKGNGKGKRKGGWGSKGKASGGAGGEDGEQSVGSAAEDEEDEETAVVAQVLLGTVGKKLRSTAAVARDPFGNRIGGQPVREV